MTLQPVLQKLLLAAAFLATLCVGIVIGVRYERTKYHAIAFFSEMVALGHASSLREVQGANGNDKAREEALKYYLAVIEHNHANGSSLERGSTYATDRAMVFVRLSFLAEHQGDQQQAKRYLDKAVALCPELNWKECNANRLVDLVQRIDAHHQDW